MDLSIVVPLYNEEESVEPLYRAISSVLEHVPHTAEMVFVDDGSRDGTFQLAAAIAATDPRLRVVKFSRNYGQTPAMAAGIDIARGNIIVTMDGDLQNDPADIPMFLQKIEDGYDIVVGWRYDRQDKLVTRKIPSKIANWLIGKVTGMPIKDNGCSLKAFRAGIIKHVPLYSEMHRFIPAMASIAGSRWTELKVRHHARRFGESKYGLSRIYKVLLDLLVIKSVVGFATRPMMWFALLAIPFFLLSSILFGVEIIALATGAERSLPVAGSALFFGVLSVFMILSGGLAELVTRTGHSDLQKFSLLTVKNLTPVADAGSGDERG